MLIAGACLSAACIVGNAICGFPLQTSLKWFVLFFVCLVGYLFSDNQKIAPHMMFGEFIFLVFLFLPFAFFDSGGSNNNALGYIFLLMIVVTYLFAGWKRIFLVCALIAVFIVMHALEYYRPELVAVYSPQAHFIDRMIHIPLLLIAVFFIILQFAKEYKRANQKLLVSAHFDELTGLYNRRLFNKAMEEGVENRDGPINLVLLDMDNFKKVNDQYGHTAGDEVLKKLSQLLQNSFELDKHVVCRWGGDEFAIIYYGEKEELVIKLEAVKKSFKTYVSVYDDTIGFSTSIITFSDYKKSSQVLVDADQLLYREKLKKDAREYLDGDAQQSDTSSTES